MKARDYYDEFINENEEKSPSFRFYKCLRGMLFEAEEIINKRRIKEASAIKAVFNEIELKACKFAKLVNSSEVLSFPVIERELFKTFLYKESKDLYDLIYREGL